MNLFKKGKLSAVVLGAVLAASPQVTTATEGYFAHGWGARHMALAGAGTANVTDASGQAHNPAGIMNVDGSEINLAITFFNPNRSYTGSAAPGFSAFGKYDSSTSLFLIPNFAYSEKIDDSNAWGFSAYGNGGMNTDYQSFARPLPDCPPTGGAGVYCAGRLGVDLVQLFLQATYAFQAGDLQIGLSPILAIQSFEAKGLGAFAASGASSNPARFTNNQHDNSSGWGGKIGINYKFSDTTDLSLVYQTKLDMSEFSDYSGLFADGGDFDIPSMLSIGAAFKPSDDVSVMLDWRKINYTDVGSVSNAGNIPLQFGMRGGPGFGWDDVNAYKIGVEWQSTETLTWRLGFATNENPIGPEDVNLNILAPGVVTKHLSGGFELDLGEGDAFEVHFTFVPSDDVQGPGLAPQQVVKLEMDQLIFGASWTFNLDD